MKKASTIIAGLGAAFLSAQAVSANTDQATPVRSAPELALPDLNTQISPRYTHLDSAFLGAGHSNADGTGSKADYFFALIRDNREHQNILCSGLRVTTSENRDTDDIQIRTPSLTLKSLWHKVADNDPAVSEYGSCITVRHGELENRNIEFLFEGAEFTDRFLVFRQDPTQPLNTWDYQQNLLNEKYPEILDQLEDAESWDDFVAEAEKYRNERTYTLDQDVSDCANAGYFWDETYDIWVGNNLARELPLCDRPDFINGRAAEPEIKF